MFVEVLWLIWLGFSGLLEEMREGGITWGSMNKAAKSKMAGGLGFKHLEF